MVARLDERLKNIEKSVSDINKKMDDGCPFGHAVKDDVEELKREVWNPGGLKDRVITLEQTQATWTARWGGSVITLSVIGQVITLAVAIWAVMK